MLPPGMRPVAEIEQELSPENQLVPLVSLLMFLLEKINPNVIPQNGPNVRTRERIEANAQMFTNVSDILFAIRVRNAVTHPEDSPTPTEAEINRAAKSLINAIKEFRDDHRLPANINDTVFRSYPARPSFTTAPQDPEPVKTTAPFASRLQTDPAATAPLSAITQPAARPTAQPTRHSMGLPPIAPTAVRSSIPWPRHPLRWVTLIIVLALALNYGGAIWQLGKDKLFGSEGVVIVRRKEAEAVIKRLQAFDKGQGFAPKVTEAQGLWRDAEIAFKQERFNQAESGYQRVLQVWDELVIKQKERDEAQKLIAEIQNGRLAAKPARAQQSALQMWQEAETARASANAALINGNFAEAKQLALQARQKYEEAKVTVEQAPTPSPEIVIAARTSPQPTTPAQPAPKPTPTIAAAITPIPRPRPTAVIEEPSSERQPTLPAEDTTFFISQKEFMYYVKKQVAPALPPEAREQGVSGPVRVEIVLSRDGHMSKAQVISGNMMLRQAALDALRQWQFKPYRQNGAQIDVRSEITIFVR